MMALPMVPTGRALPPHSWPMRLPTRSSLWRLTEQSCCSGNTSASLHLIAGHTSHEYIVHISNSFKLYNCSHFCKVQAAVHSSFRLDPQPMLGHVGLRTPFYRICEASPVGKEFRHCQMATIVCDVHLWQCLKQWPCKHNHGSVTTCNL